MVILILSQNANGLMPIYSTLCGILMADNDIQPLKTSSCIVNSPLGNDINLRFLQEENASEPIYLIDFGRVISIILLEAKALSQMTSTP